MNKVLIVVTSHRLNPKRVYHGSDEWCDGWKFLDSEQYKLRTKKMTVPSTVNSMTELAQLAAREDTIIWIRGKDRNVFPSVEIGQLIKSLRKQSEVHLAYHDEFVGDRVASVLGGERDQFIQYSLSKGGNPKGFKGILKMDRKRQAYLNAEAEFSEIFACFFLDPTNVFELVLHRVTNVLGAIEFNLQYLENEDFKADAWQQIVDVYKNGGASERLNECRCVIYKNTISLQRLYDKKSVSLPSEKNAELQTSWLRLTELLPEEEKGNQTTHRQGRSDHFRS